MIWTRSTRFSVNALPIADRHYNRQKPGTPQFVPPGRCLVLLAANALWVTSWPFAEFTKHKWAGAWVNSLFRKEGLERTGGKWSEGEGFDETGMVASDYICQAVAATRSHWPDVPALGMVTFIDPKEVKPRKIRSRPTWGHCYFEAGFKHVGYTGKGLWAFQLLPADMPEPETSNWRAT